MYLKSKNLRHFYGKFIAVFGLFLCLSLSASAAVYTLKELSPDTYGVNTGILHNGQALWQEVRDYQPEIFFWDGNQTVRVTYDPDFESNVSMHSGTIFWIRDYDIMMWKNGLTTIITTSSNNKKQLMTFNGQAVWTEGIGASEEIFFYNGSQVLQLTHNSVADNSPWLNNGKVVWTDKSNIYLYNGKIIKVIASGLSNATRPIIDGSFILWQAGTTTGTELFLYSGGSTKQITNNSKTEFSYGLDNGQVAWLEDSGNYFYYPQVIRPIQVYDLFLYNGSETIQLSATCNANFSSEQMDNGEIVWVESTAEMSNRDLLVYNGFETALVVDDYISEHTPVIDNSQILWNRGNDILVLGTPTDTALKLQYQEGHDAGQSEWMKPNMRLINEGDAPVALNTLSIRYWYTNETAPANQELVVDLFMNESNWNPIGSWPYPSVSGSFHAVTPVSGANTYLEIRFSSAAGDIAPGSAVQLKTGIHASNWAAFVEADDYSFNQNLKNFTDWNKITVYQNGQLIWGVEP